MPRPTNGIQQSLPRWFTKRPGSQRFISVHSRHLTEYAAASRLRDKKKVLNEPQLKHRLAFTNFRNGKAFIAESDKSLFEKSWGKGEIYWLSYAARHLPWVLLVSSKIGSSTNKEESLMKKFLGLAVGVFLLIGFFSSAEAVIKIEIAEVQNGFAFVKGSCRTASATLTLSGV